MTGQMGDNESSVQLIPPASQLQDYQAGPVDGQRRRKLETLLIEEPVNSQNGRASSSRRKSTTDRSIRASLLRLWWAELLAASFSLACIIVQAGLLRMLDDEPFGTWRLIRTDINPNTLISILATLNRSSLLLYVTQGIAQLKWPYFQRQSHRLSDLQIFDDASRGPLGSLYLLWSVNIKATVACLGAFIVVLALFVEPFTQQIIAPSIVVAVAHNESASLAATNIYWWDSWGNQSQALVLEYQVTILSAVAQPAADPQYDCPSGNCTWNEYSSLGICNFCENITREAEVSCGPLRHSTQTNHSDFLADLGLCTYRIPSGVGEDDFFWTLWAPWFDSFENGTRKSNSKTYYPSTWWNTTVNDPHGPRLSSGLANITNLVFTDSITNYTSLDMAYSVLPNITRCSMTWCKQTFPASSVENGTLHDRSISNVPIYINSTTGYGATQPHALWLEEHSASAAELHSWSPNLAGALDEVYYVDDMFPTNVPSMLADILGYTYFTDGTQDWDEDEITNTTAQADLLNALIPSTKSGGNPLGWSQQVFEGDDGRNISATLDNVAVALTNLIRRSPNVTSVQGFVHRPTVLIRIRWVWFIYPVSISTLSIVFLALVMTLSNRKGELVWKASGAALAFHGLRSGQDSEVGLVDLLKIRDAAESKWVKLAPDDDGKLALRTS
ncbi:hypothetical protein LTR17_013383 [Elasticomyces elasticus]|nr:hypothetical protein LTR17_013383 [Elasticomyces elasticus]